MGQKVNAVGMRVGINRDWNSKWFASKKEYGDFLVEDIAIRKYLDKELKNSMLSHITIERVKTDKNGYPSYQGTWQDRKIWRRQA